MTRYPTPFAGSSALDLKGWALAIVLSLGLLGCRSSDADGTCRDALEHTAALSVARTGSSLETSQRARHQAVLARALERDLGPRCDNDDGALIDCVLDSRTPSHAKACWRNR